MNYGQWAVFKARRVNDPTGKIYTISLGDDVEPTRIDFENNYAEFEDKQGNKYTTKGIDPEIEIGEASKQCLRKHGMNDYEVEQFCAPKNKIQKDSFSEMVSVLEI